MGQISLKAVGASKGFKPFVHVSWRALGGQVGPESVGASEGFLGWIAYLGAANAGIPLSIIVKNYGWEVRRLPRRHTRA